MSTWFFGGSKKDPIPDKKNSDADWEHYKNNKLAANTYGDTSSNSRIIPVNTSPKEPFQDLSEHDNTIVGNVAKYVESPSNDDKMLKDQTDAKVDCLNASNVQKYVQSESDDEDDKINDATKGESTKETETSYASNVQKYDPDANSSDDEIPPHKKNTKPNYEKLYRIEVDERKHYANEIMKKDKKIAELNQIVEEKVEETSILRNELSSARDINTKLSNDASKLRFEMENWKQTSMSKHNEALSNLEKVKVNENVYREEAEVAKMNAVKNLKIFEDKNRQQRDAMQRNLDELSNEYSKVVNNHKDLEKKYVQMDNNHREQYQNESRNNVRISRQLKEANDKIETYERQIAQMKKRMTELEVSVNREQRDEMQRNLDELNNEYSKVVNNHKDLEKKYVQMDNNHREQYQNESRNNVRISRQLKEANDKIETYERQIAQMKKKMTELEASIEKQSEDTRLATVRGNGLRDMISLKDILDGKIDSNSSSDEDEDLVSDVKPKEPSIDYSNKTPTPLQRNLNNVEITPKVIPRERNFDYDEFSGKQVNNSPAKYVEKKVNDSPAKYVEEKVNDSPAKYVEKEINNSPAKYVEESKMQSDDKDMEEDLLEKIYILLNSKYTKKEILREFNLCNKNLGVTFQTLKNRGTNSN